MSSTIVIIAIRMNNPLFDKNFSKSAPIYNILNKKLMYMNKYKYTQRWFLDSEINKNIFNFVKKNSEISILEIGCYEGLSSVFFADNLLNHDKSSMVCIDPFLSIPDNDHKQLLANKEEDNFDHNIKKCDNRSKISVFKITSDEFFKKNVNVFNLIYIDGCHEPDFIERDMENAFQILVKGGIMWMDDYCGGDRVTIKATMDKFVEKYSGKCDIIHRGYQLAILKL